VRKPESNYTLAIAALTGALLCIPGYQVFAGDSGKHTPTSSVASSEGAPKSGEQVFMENCSRCHKPPMTIAPRITGTIVMHMRVRAKLSREDEKALLHYLAP